MPHYAEPTTVPKEPEPPTDWETGLRFWVSREGLIWGVYWAIRSRWINRLNTAAYFQRHDDYMKDMAETLWEADARWGDLSHRERQVMYLLAHKTAEQVAAEMGITAGRVRAIERGVRAHMRPAPSQEGEQG